MALFQNTHTYYYYRKSKWYKMGNRAAKMLIDRLESEEEHDEEENYKTEVIETHLKGNLLIRLLV
jgi:hypothetical protein